MVKVAMVTPWGRNVRCGIRTYSENLVKALAEAGVDAYVVRLPRFGKKTPEILQMISESIPVDKVDLVHVQHEYGLFQHLEDGFFGYLKRLELPVVTTCHAVGVWDADRVIAESSDRVIVHNGFCAERFEGPSVVIPHGCAPAETMEKARAKRSYGLKPGWPIVGYLGFISEYKGLETLIDAMEGVKAGLLIGGGWHVEKDTMYITRLKKRSFEVLPSRVQWLGYVEDEDLPRAYGSMDLVVYPSKYSTESGALLTALSYGKAVIASRIGPFKEKEVALMTFKNVKDLRRKIKRLLKRKELRAELEEKARKYAEDNSWSKVAEKHIELYREVTAT